MYDILKALASLQNWFFHYGRSDFRNLHDEVELTHKDAAYLFLDPVERSKNRNDSGVVESITYSGSFMLLKSSDIDEVSYENRYEKFILPMLEEQIEAIEEDLICNNEASLEEWKTLEVINILDYNLDGIIVTYRVTIEE